MSSTLNEFLLSKTKGKAFDTVKKLNCWASNLKDVSFLKEMPNIEILTLSVNEISTLRHVQHCPKITELYIRNNKIKDLNEIYFLKQLNNLRILWLADNECTKAMGDTMYRYTVLRNLPNLQKLDNAQVTEEEMENALKLGKLIDIEPDEKMSNEETNSDLYDSITFSTDVNKYILPAKDEIKSTDENSENFEESIQTELLVSKVIEDENGLAVANDDVKNETEKTELTKMETLDLTEIKDMNFTISENVKNERSDNSRGLKMQNSALSSHIENLQKETNSKKEMNSNILDAILLLLNELNNGELDKVIFSCQQRKKLLE